jgi:PmbA protein
MSAYSQEDFMNSERNQTSILSAVLENAKRHCDQAELFHLETRELSGGHRAGQLRELSESQNSGLCLRIIKDGRIAQTSTSNMEKAHELVDQALELVPFGEKVDFEFPGSAEISMSGFPDPRGSDSDIMKIVESGRQVVERIKAYDPEIITHAGAGQEVTSIRIINSKGIDQAYSVQRCSHAAAGVLAREGNILQTYISKIGRTFSHNPDELAEQVIDLIELGKVNISFKSEVLPIVFTPRAFADLLAAFGAGVSGSSVAKGMSPLVDKIGEQILHPDVTIIDDGLFPDGFGSQPFDDEGIPCETKYLVDKGMLTNYVTDLKTASKMNLKSTGNGFRYTSLIKSRSYTASAGPAFTNLIVTPGTRTQADILLQTERVLLVDQLTGVLLGNLINGDWSGNVEFGILYENGEPLGRIKNVMTGGNFYKMFKDQFVEFSSDRTWVTGFGGGSGSNFLPSALIEGMNLSA